MTTESHAPEWYGPVDTDGQPCNFNNIYDCSECGAVWSDRWSCACDDRCRACGHAMSPSISYVTDLETGKIDPWC